MTSYTLRRLLPSLACALIVAACASPTTGSDPAQPGNNPGGTVAATPGMSANKQIPVGKSPHGMWATADFVYNSNVGDSTISVIDARTDAVVKTLILPNGGVPGYAKAFHDGKHIAIADTKNGAVVIIDPAKDHAIIQAIAVGSGVDKLRIEEDDMLVAMTNESKVSVFHFGGDRSQPPTRKDFVVGSVAGTGERHRDTAFDAGWIVSPNSGENNVSLINLGNGQVQNVTGGNNPGPVGIGTLDGVAVAAIVGNAASNTITLFEMPGGAPHTLSNVGLSPTDMVVDPELGRVYVTMAGSNTVAVIDYVAKKLVGSVSTGSRPVHIYMAPLAGQEVQAEADQAATEAKVYDQLHRDPGPLSHELWVGNDSGASVTIINGETLAVKATVATDEGHHKMAFAHGKGYVSNTKARNISVIDRSLIK